MDKNFIKENKLDETINRFQELAGYKYPKQSLKNLYEYTIFNPQVNEEGEEQNQQQPQGGAPDPSMQGGGMNAQTGGQMPPDGSGMAQNGQMPTDGGMGMPMGGEPNGGGGMPMDSTPIGNEGPTGGEPMGNEEPMGGDMDDMQGMDDAQEPPMGDDEEEVETTEMEPDDEVIDVDDLTQSQEATEYKIDGVDDRLSKIFKVVQKFNDKLDKQQQSIMKLKDEFERRNPTQTEKFNLRSQASGPFNQTPTEYWDKLSQENPNYQIIRDNSVSPSEEQKKYEIRRGDIDGLNMKNIADTLNIDQKLKDYIGF